MTHRGVREPTAAAEVIAGLLAAARARAVSRSVVVTGAAMLVLALPQAGVTARASSLPGGVVKQSGAVLPPGTTLTFKAVTSFTDSCSSVWLASPGCAAPNWAGVLAYGPAQVSYQWAGKGTLTSSDPINAQGSGSAKLTEPKIDISGSGTWSESSTAGCQITATSGVASTGHSVSSVLKAHLTPITNGAGAVTGFKLLTSLAYPKGGGGPGPAELENWSWQQTANPDTGQAPCTSGSYPHLNERDGNAGQAVYGVAYFDGDVTATGKIQTTGWTINPSWNVKTGGVWATKTINQKIPYNYYSDPTVTDQGNITVAETYQIVTSP